MAADTPPNWKSYPSCSESVRGGLVKGPVAVSADYMESTNGSDTTNGTKIPLVLARKYVIDHVKSHFVQSHAILHTPDSASARSEIPLNTSTNMNRIAKAVSIRL